MSLPLNKLLRCTDKEKRALLVDTTVDENLMKVVYVGYIKSMDGTPLVPGLWTGEGICVSYTGSATNILLPIVKFSVGKWRTINPAQIANVTTLSPHVSSQYRLIGYVYDQEGRMFPERWDFDGKPAGNPNWKLDPYADHNDLPF